MFRVPVKAHRWAETGPALGCTKEVPVEAHLSARSRCLCVCLRLGSPEHISEISQQQESW